MQKGQGAAKYMREKREKGEKMESCMEVFLGGIVNTVTQKPDHKNKIYSIPSTLRIYTENDKS